MVLDLTNPSETELNRLGIGLKTYEENYVCTAKMGGICYWSNLYTLLYFSTVGSTIVLSTIFMVSNHLRGEKEVVLETVHFMFLALNSIAMVTDYNVNQQYYLQLYRAFDKGVFDYGDSLDEETIRNIEEIKSGARERKRKFGYVFSSLLKVIAVVHTLKKPLSRLVIGGKQPTNGADDLLWEAPIGVYMPFSDYWAPYIFGHLLSTGCGILIATTAVASTTTYQYISEELLAEYAIVRLTFERCVFRAEHLQKSILFSTFKKLVYMPLFMSVTDGGLMLCMSSYLTICGDISLELRLSMPGFVGSECLLMFIYCDYGEKLSKANADVGDGLYNAEKLSDHLNQLKPYLATVVRFTNVPKELSAGGFTAVNRQIFANIPWKKFAMVLDLTNPSDKELNRLGFGLKTYKENYLFTAKMGGLCRWSDLYTFLYFSTMGLSLVLNTIFIVIISLQGEKEAALEMVHFAFLSVNTIAKAALYNINQQYYLQLYRAFDKGFDYGDSLDDETIRDIAEIKKGARDRKSAFGNGFSRMLKVIVLIINLKKPATRLLHGSKHPVDGEDNLIWEAPLAVYMPFANYWIPYIVGVLISVISSILVAITALATTATYQFTCEEILAEYAVVKLTFERCIVRAEHLFRAEGRSSDFNACLRHCVNLSVKHHQEAFRMFSIFKKMMRVPLFIAISDGGLLLCMSCYLTICDDISMHLRLAMPTWVISECLLMLIYCDYGEKLSDANAAVGDGMYNAEKLPDNLILLKPYLVIVKQFTDIPKQLSAGGFSAVNRETFANVIRAAYSYMGFLLST